VFDYNTPIDALTYDNKWDLSNGHKFGLAVYYDKLGSNILTDHADAQAWSNDNIPISKYPFFLRADGAGDDFSFKDQDYDIFGVEATYEWETGGVSLGVQYDRDLTDPTVEKDYAVYINPAFVQSFGPFAIHFEGIFGWGERTYDKAAVNPADWTGLYGIEQAYFGHEWDGTFKSRGLGLYLDGVYTYDQGDVTLSGWYVSGTDLDEKDGKSNSLVKLGDFAPFLVAFNNQTLGTGVFSDDLGSGAFDHYANDLINSSPLGGGTYNFSGFNTGLTNQWGVAILGNHTLVPDFIKMNYGIGYFRLVKPAFTWLELDDGSYMAAPFVPETDISALPVMGGRQVVGHRKQSKDLGWEIDLGFTFQIVENVWFETQFGYFFNGDAFEYFDGTGWKDPKDTFAWANVLAFDF
jgi:hypothetical protein